MIAHSEEAKSIKLNDIEWKITWVDTLFHNTFSTFKKLQTMETQSSAWNGLCQE